MLYLCIVELRVTSYKIKIFGDAHICFYGEFVYVACNNETYVYYYTYRNRAKVDTLIALFLYV
jgi:hypothetical protein